MLGLPLVNAATGRHAYATESAPPAGFSTDGTLGYLDAAPNGGSALYRHDDPSSGDSLLTTSATPPVGYQLQGMLGYLHTGTPTTYLRNALGQVLTAQSPAGTTTSTYDLAHRVASVTDSRGGKQLTYSYSAGGGADGPAGQ